MAITIRRKKILEAVGLLPSKPTVFGQGVKVRIASTRPHGTPKVWENGDEAMVIRRWPYSGAHDKRPEDDLYEVQLIARDGPRQYFTFKELEVA
jgi:hypothetical protein